MPISSNPPTYRIHLRTTTGKLMVVTGTKRKGLLPVLSDHYNQPGFKP